MTNIGHFAPASAIGAYGLAYMWKALSKYPKVGQVTFGADQTTDKNEKLAAKRKMQLFEAVSLICVGFIFVVVMFPVLLNCKNVHPGQRHCQHENTMHILLGVLLLLAGIFQILSMTPILSGYPDITSGIVFGSIGFMFLGHGQDTDQEILVHRVLGVVLMLAGLLKTIADEYERLRLITSVMILYATVLILFGMPMVTSFVLEHDISAFNEISMTLVALFLVLIGVSAAKLLELKYFRDSSRVRV